MAVITYIVQKTSQTPSEDILPSVFNTFAGSELATSEAANNLVTRLFSLQIHQLIAIEALMHPQSLPIRINVEDNREKLKRNNSFL